MKLRAGDWVEVKSREEILRSLDKKGRLEALPFMPQMFRYCGQRFKVFKRAHKACDTVTNTGNRRLVDGIHLETRCDGEAYGGCQAACLIFWKEAWLKPISDKCNSVGQTSRVESLQSVELVNGTSMADMLAATLVDDQITGEETRYVCQATEMPGYTTLLPWWDVRQYIEDYTSGNVTLSQMLNGFAYFLYFRLVKPFVRTALFLNWLYDKFQDLTGGTPYPGRQGTIPAGQSTPSSTLNLQPGEMVRVKSYSEILTTLDTKNKNRGLYFDAELVPYCGGTFRVRTRVTKFLDEKTGRMSTMKIPAIILEGVWCRSRYSQCRMFCPRSIYSWWREIWLERLPEGAQLTDSTDERKESSH